MREIYIRTKSDLRPFTIGEVGVDDNGIENVPHHPYPKDYDYNFLDHRFSEDGKLLYAFGESVGKIDIEDKAEFLQERCKFKVGYRELDPKTDEYSESKIVDEFEGTFIDAFKYLMAMGY